jgi:hypothetical protein
MLDYDNNGSTKHIARINPLSGITWRIKLMRFIELVLTINGFEYTLFSSVCAIQTWQWIVLQHNEWQTCHGTVGEIVTRCSLNLEDGYSTRGCNILYPCHVHHVISIHSFRHVIASSSNITTTRTVWSNVCNDLLCRIVDCYYWTTKCINIHQSLVF